LHERWNLIADAVVMEGAVCFHDQTRLVTQLTKLTTWERRAMHSVVTEVKNRNAACVMEVASLGYRATMRTKEGGKIRKSRFFFRPQPQPYLTLWY